MNDWLKERTQNNPVEILSKNTVTQMIKESFVKEIRDKYFIKDISQKPNGDFVIEWAEIPKWDTSPR